MKAWVNWVGMGNAEVIPETTLNPHNTKPNNMSEKHTMTAQAKRLSGSRKREFVFDGTQQDRPFSTSSYWDSGSKTSYSVINMLTGQTGFCPTGSYPDFRAEYQLKPQELLIETSIFMGKPGTARFTCRIDDESLARKFLGITAVATIAA